VPPRNFVGRADRVRAFHQDHDAGRRTRGRCGAGIEIGTRADDARAAFALYAALLAVATLAPLWAVGLAP
jgi:hypothetical protein